MLSNSKDLKIIKRVEEHYNYIAQLYPPKQILGVFLYGSQNYGTDTENSDVDTKAILVPTLEDLCLNRPVSKKIHLPNGEHCEVKDIREMVKNFRKQNINFIEILFTKYKITNLRYDNIWNEYFISQREDIARYDMQKGIQSTVHQAVHSIKQNPTDGKKISNGLRLQAFINLYNAGTPYESCLYLNDEEREILKNIKTGKTAYLKDPNELVKELIYFLPDADSYTPNLEHQEKIDNQMNQGIIELVKKLID